jgi:hypothetical protein
MGWVTLWATFSQTHQVTLLRYHVSFLFPFKYFPEKKLSAFFLFYLVSSNNSIQVFCSGVRSRKQSRPVKTFTTCKFKKKLH